MNEKARIGKRVTTNTLLMNAFLVAIKLIAGLVFRSGVLVADAFHSLTDVLTTIFVYFGISISSKPADEEHPFGHEKAELIVSKIVAIFLFITAAGIAISAVQGIRNEVVYSPGYIALVVVIISIVMNEVMYYYSVRVGKKIGSQALIADGWHHRSDSLSSIAALIGVGGVILGYPILDPIAAIVVALIIARAGFKIYMQSVKELMDTAPSKQAVDRIRSIILNHKLVLEIDSLKAIFHLNHIDVYLHIKVDNNLTIEEGHKLTENIKEDIFNQCENIQEINVYIKPIR